jgi:hypothetical protein
MSQQMNDYVPPVVARVLREAHETLGGEVTLRRTPPDRWQILSETTEDGSTMAITVTFKRSPSGRMPKPKIRIWIDGSVSYTRSWETLKDFLTTEEVSVPPPLEEDASLTPPRKLAGQKEIIEQKLNTTARVRLAKVNNRWVLGIDSIPENCDCEERPCEHEFSLRFGYIWKHGSWRSDRNHFLALMFGMDLTEQWREQQPMLLRLLTKVIPGSDDSKQERPDGRPRSSTPAGGFGAVAARRASVIRV